MNWFRKALELERMFQTEELTRMNEENSYALSKGEVTIFEYERIKTKIKFDYDSVMNKISQEESNSS